jgi:hypothetical protein
MPIAVMLGVNRCPASSSRRPRSVLLLNAIEAIRPMPRPAATYVLMIPGSIDVSTTRGRNDSASNAVRIFECFQNAKS